MILRLSYIYATGYVNKEGVRKFRRKVFHIWIHCVVDERSFMSRIIV